MARTVLLAVTFDRGGMSALTITLAAYAGSDVLLDTQFQGGAFGLLLWER